MSSNLRNIFILILVDNLNPKATQKNAGHRVRLWTGHVLGPLREVAVCDPG